MTERLTPDFEKTLRRYVLGDVDDELRSELEELLVTDPDAFEALGVVEDQLIEEYLEGATSEADRLAFERHFLTSPRREARLRFARSLRSRATLGKKTAAPSADAQARWQPAWLGLAAALAASLVGNVWQASRPSQSVATFALSGGQLRSQTAQGVMTVPSDAVVVRLLMAFADVGHSLYRASVLDEEGRELWTASRLTAQPQGEGKAVMLTLPSSLLSRGDYQVRLSGVLDSGELETLETYVFRVTGSVNREGERP